MSKQKRTSSGQFASRRSTKFLIGIWTVAIASLSLVWLAARAVLADLGGFRSCSESTGILTVNSCGKHSLNFGDIVLIGLFTLTACFSISLLTGAWRVTRKGAMIA
jgi:hypothetical protein